MQDGDVIYLARQMDGHLSKLRELVTLIECSDHPNAAELVNGLRANNLDNAAWATHCVRHALEHPEWYQTGDFGIRRKKRLTDPDHVSSKVIAANDDVGAEEVEDDAITVYAVDALAAAEDSLATDVSVPFNADTWPGLTPEEAEMVAALPADAGDEPEVTEPEAEAEVAQVGWIITDPDGGKDAFFCGQHLTDGTPGFDIAQPLHDDASDRGKYGKKKCATCAKLIFPRSK